VLNTEMSRTLHGSFK